ncbi:DUF1345 domain-containing protein [Aestuariimicrobium soli]|uniref:DUF1345 domain-containing protein n=1 Tax=Aestuariimicrobium soli TaxID=2035834 RepID=UPI003EB9DF4F
MTETTPDDHLLPPPAPTLTTAQRLLGNELGRHGLAMMVAVVVGLLASLWFVVTRTRGSGLALLLTSYGLYGFTYLGLSHWLFRGLRGVELREVLRATSSPSSTLRAWLLGLHPTSWGLTSALLAMAAVGAVVGFGRDWGGAHVMISAVLCLLGSWVLLFATFAVEYARLWASGEHLRFPTRPGDRDDQVRAFEDFIYLGVQVSTTFASSDVELLTTRVRRLVTTQALVGFVYSTVILALFISLVLTRV